MNTKLKIKVCGMKDPANINEIAALNPDFMGFIFYEKSLRYAGNMDVEPIVPLPDTIRKVAVFVNQTVAAMQAMASKYSIRTLQLHGEATPAQCLQLMESGFTVIKAVPVSQPADVEAVENYEGYCHYFLFDTKTPHYGGSGSKFDWTWLEKYRGKTPFILSGGIDIFDIQSINKIDHPAFFGVDINSRFEIEPGIKNKQQVEQFILSLRNV
jgi:phosphoribosylanthranilate isomerase